MAIIARSVKGASAIDPDARSGPIAVHASNCLQEKETCQWRDGLLILTTAMSPHTDRPAINGSRLCERHREMASIGATGRGGVNRQALTAQDAEGRRLLISWAQARGYLVTIDAIGNLFVRRPGTRGETQSVMTGSHLDTQPTGGNFDGVFGVLAGLEVLETLDDAHLVTPRPIDLVIWMNEEGSRFPPPTMGSAVYAKAMPLERALDTADADGVLVREALLDHIAHLPKLQTHDTSVPPIAYVEAHIEQGPVLEDAGCQIGVVTGIQGLYAYEVHVTGREAHAGTTPLHGRRDAFVAATDLIGRLRENLKDPADLLRFTVGKFHVSPGSPNTVPGQVTFSIDLRHPDPDVLGRAGETVLETCSGEAGGCMVTARTLLQSLPVSFDPRAIEIVRSAAVQQHLHHRDLVSGATHDAKFMAALMPTAMVFIPCKDGVSHNETESARAEDMAAGTQVLCDTLIALSRMDTPLR